MSKNKYSTDSKMKHSLWKERLKTGHFRKTLNQQACEKSVVV